MLVLGREWAKIIPISFLQNMFPYSKTSKLVVDSLAGFNTFQDAKVARGIWGVGFGVLDGLLIGC